MMMVLWLSLNTGIPGPPMPGECQNPMYLDRVCLDFPQLRLCMAHGADPWWGVAIRLMIKYRNLHLMTSAYSIRPTTQGLVSAPLSWAELPSANPADLDYFYGRYVTPQFTADFLDWEAGIDVTEPADGISEDVGVRMAFLNEGTGRAEADAAGGSLAAGEEGRAVECWNAALSETYLSYEQYLDGVGQGPVTDGDPANCLLFNATLDELRIPSLDDIDPALRAALDDVARNGVPAE